MAISSPGIGSNLPIDQLITDLMNNERLPLTTLARKEASYTQKLSAYGSLSGAVSAFQSAMASLNASTFQGLKAAVGDATIFSANPGNKAVAGNYQVKVTQLAQGQMLSAVGQGSKTAPIGSGTATTISFQLGTISGGTLANGVYTGASFVQDADQTAGTITIDSSNNSLQGISDAINAANLGVKASITSDGSGSPERLVLTSSKTGEKSSMKITVDGDADLENLLAYDPTGTQKLTQNNAAQNTNLTVNGLLISSATNTVNDVMGMTLNVLKIGESSLSVSQDTSSLEKGINDFIKAYNELNKTIKDLTAYTPSTVKGQAGTGGPLVGDATVRTIQEQVRKTLSSSLEGLSNTSMSLSKIGVAFQKDGSLALDSAKLKTAMTSNFSDIGALFATIGKATDSLINFSNSTAATKAGSYPITVSKLATQAKMTGDVDLSAGSTIIAPNTKLSVKVDGISATVILTEGSYTAEALATMLQAAVNGTSALSSAGVKISAKVDADGHMQVISDRYGSASNVEIASNAGTSANTIFGSVTTGSIGEDVVGTIGGVAAAGSGQFLTGASGTAAEGLKLEIVGGALGDRGRIDFSQGYADRLKKLADGFIGTDGLISGRTTGINNSIAALGKQGDALELRLVQIEKNYRAQFAALDVLIAGMNSTSTFLTQQLAQIASLSSQ